MQFLQHGLRGPLVGRWRWRGRKMAIFLCLLVLAIFARLRISLDFYSPCSFFLFLYPGFLLSVSLAFQAWRFGTTEVVFVLLFSLFFSFRISVWLSVSSWVWSVLNQCNRYAERSGVLRRRSVFDRLSKLRFASVISFVHVDEWCMRFGD